MSLVRIPPDLQPVLREYTKAVLRDKPDDVIRYSCEYFGEKWETIRLGAAHNPPLPVAAPSSISAFVVARAASYELPPSESSAFGELPADAVEKVSELFKRYDTDSDCALTIDELHRLLVELGGLFSFGSTAQDTNTLMALLDVDGSNTVSWQEWSHACAVWLLEIMPNAH